MLVESQTLQREGYTHTHTLAWRERGHPSTDLLPRWLKWFTFQMVTASLPKWVEVNQSETRRHELPLAECHSLSDRAQLYKCHMGAGAQGLGHSFAAFPDLRGSWIRNQAG